MNAVGVELVFDQPVFVGNEQNPTPVDHAVQR